MGFIEIMTTTIEKYFLDSGYQDHATRQILKADDACS